MSSNNDNSGTMAIAFVMAGLAMAAMFLYAFAAFIAVVFTGLAFSAWNRPLTLFGETMHPHEARAFVRNGIIGAFLAPAFAIFTSALLNYPISEDAWPHIFIVGYILGSLGVEMLKAEEEQRQQSNPKALPPSLPNNDAPKSLPKRETEPFRFADWDDEGDS